jgi:hypothetical protein
VDVVEAVGEAVGGFIYEWARSCGIR